MAIYSSSYFLKQKTCKFLQFETKIVACFGHLIYDNFLETKFDKRKNPQTMGYVPERTDNKI